MAPFYTFNTKSTSIDFPWPAEISGLERIMLSAQGDLQRVMSAFFARPIIISTLFAHTYTQLAPGLPPSPLSLPNSIALASASPDHPITQTRQVQLVCADKVVCTATSTVQVTSERCARFFLQDKYPIGQMFRKLEKLPTFELLEVGFGAPTSRKGENLGVSPHGGELWRRYKLTVPEFECEILEVFPSRKMFTLGETWLLDGPSRPSQTMKVDMDMEQSMDDAKWQRAFLLFFAVGFFLLLAWEIMMFLGVRSTC